MPLSLSVTQRTLGLGQHERNIRTSTVRAAAALKTGHAKESGFHAAVVSRQTARVVTVRTVCEVAEPSLAATTAREEKPVVPNPPHKSSIKVAKTGEVPEIAGKISHSTRDGVVPEVWCVGSDCIYLTVKAIIKSRTFLADDNIDLSFKPCLQNIDPKEGRDAYKGLVFKLSKNQGSYVAKSLNSPTLDLEPTEEASVINVRDGSKHWLSGGALAARVREQVPVAVMAVGAKSVQQAVLTVIKAREYLRGDGKDLSVVPEYVKIKRDGRQEWIGIKFNIVVEDIPVPNGATPYQGRSADAPEVALEAAEETEDSS